MAKEYSQVNFRIPTKLKDQIEQAAIQNERSITSELVARLEQSFLIADDAMTEQDLLYLRNEIQEIKNLLLNTRNKAP